jgi:regulator of protease activity HflC (stomatin/prohibitin superfamily)
MSKRPKERDRLLDVGDEATQGGTFVASALVTQPRRDADHSKAYEVIRGVMTEEYLVHSADELYGRAERANSTAAGNAFRNTLSYMMCCLGACFSTSLVVNQGELGLGYSSDGRYNIHGPGASYLFNAFYRFQGAVSIRRQRIQHGDIQIITVPQGQVAYLEDLGHPVVLGFGTHYIKSATMEFKAMVELNSNVIHLGPFTILTVEAGYCAITQDNGEQKVLPGDRVHLLTHTNWTFVKFIPTKLQTREFGPCSVSTADGVVIPEISGEVIFQITDPRQAARVLIQAMRGAPEQRAGGRHIDLERESRIPKLEGDLQRLTIGALTEAIGRMNFSNVPGASGARREQAPSGTSPPTYAATQNASIDQMVAMITSEHTRHDIAKELNRILSGQASHELELSHTTSKRPARDLDDAPPVLENDTGVRIIEVKLRKPVPSADIQQRLAAAATARAAALEEAERARGEATALEYKATGKAKSARIEAQGYADALGIRTAADLDAAEKISGNPLAAEVKRTQALGEAQGMALSSFKGAVLVSGKDGPLPQIAVDVKQTLKS